MNSPSDVQALKRRRWVQKGSAKRRLSRIVGRKRGAYVHYLFNRCHRSSHRSFLILTNEGAMAWYRVMLRCDGIPPACGVDGAKCITANFANRSWHKNAICSWDGKHLTLSVENDFDRDGRAVMDEFSDEISACIPVGFDGDLSVISVAEMNE